MTRAAALPVNQAYTFAQGGYAAESEAASIACVYAFLVTMLIYRDYKGRELHLLLHRVVKTVGMVMILIAFAGLVGYAYLGDFQPDQSDVRQPVELQIEN